ncbi:MAG: translation initiation factor IF-2, partial [Clostridia bacterium]|nr:translation initiation factor IF-2 [Clostridia bacterium]
MANQSLQNLKRIHELQKEGEISKLLQSLKLSKTNVEEFGRNVSKRLKEIEFELAQKALAKQEEEKKVEQEEVKLVEKAEVKQQTASFVTPNNNYRKFNQEARPSRNDSQNRGQRFDNRPNERGNRPNNLFNKDRGNKPGFSPRPNFNNNQGQRKGGNPGTNFVASKANKFKSFASNDVIEIDVKNDRNYENKARNLQKHSVNYDEKKGQGKRRDEQKRNNVYIEDENGFEEIRFGSRKTVKKKKEQTASQASAITHAVLTSKEITVKDFIDKIGKPVTEIVKKLMLLGIMATINSNIDYETAELVASDFGITLEIKPDKSYEEKLIESAEQKDDESQLVKRAPIVAVMGHVDHGKTSLLDAFRKTNVVLGEAGGITQSIGAYQIEFNGEKITFIDTPGHAAFTQMRARGAKATDIAILVVAADDGVMPQTVEAINHIKAAEVPIIVAINKMDKPEANPDRIKQQLAEHNVLPEEWGGDAICVPISAKTGMGLDELKQTILLVSEMCELKANPNKMATAVVIEAELDKNRGPVASVIVQNGTLHVGDSIMSGITYGKVRAMFNDQGKPIKSALPSTPVEILGFNEVPVSGDEVYAVEETLSKQVIQERIDRIKKERAMQSSGVTLDNFMNRVQEGSLKNLNVIVKTDTMGSVEALKSTLLGIRNEEAKVNIVHSGAGAVTESDVILAQTTGSVIICFNQKPVAKAKALAESLKIEIKEYKIIYEIVDDITAVINGMLSVKYEEQYIGSAEI